MKRTTNPALNCAPGPARGLRPDRLPQLLVLLGLSLGLAWGPVLGRAQSGPAIFIKTVASRPRVFAGQAFTVRYLLYHRIPVVDPQTEATLTFTNCYVEEYPAAPAERIESVGGQPYQVRTLRQYLLVPQLAGPLVLPVLRQRYRSSTPPAPEDFFGQPRLMTTSVRSTTLRVPVRALPPPPDSVRFCHAVGQFRGQLTHTVSSKADNLLTVSLRLTGTGNLKNLKLPPPPLAAGLDVFDERQHEQHTLAAQGLVADAAAAYDLLANYRGTYRLAGPAPVYFDPDLGRYVAIDAPPFAWRVTAGGLPPAAAAPAAQPGRAALSIRADLRDAAGGGLFFGSRTYYGLLLLAGLLFAAGIGLDRRQQARAANPGLYQAKNARREALRALRKIRQAHFHYNDALGKRLDSVLLIYLADRLGLTASGWPPQGLPAALQAGGVPPALQARTLAWAGELGRLRFSGRPPTARPAEFYTQELASIINALDAHLHQPAFRPAA